MENRSKLFACCIVVMLGAFMQLRATTLVVDQYGTYTTIQSALDVAVSGDTILLTAGQIFSGEGNVNLTIDNTELTFGKTGDVADPVIDLSGVAYFLSITSSATVAMSDLFIMNGSNTDGGALANNGSLMTLSCTFSANSANNDGGVIDNNGTLVVQSCRFINNSATEAGGAISSFSRLTVQDSTFINNSATSFGGCLAIVGTAVVSDLCVFTGNNVRDRGGVIYNMGTVYVTDCSFDRNYTTGEVGAGGVIYNYNGTTEISGSTFTFNSAYVYGGALINVNTTLLTTATLNGQDCVFIGNSARYGGAMCTSGENADTAINCSRFTGNSAGVSGAAIYNNSTEEVISPTVNAENNWWGSNTPDALVLFGNTKVDFEPYITMTLTAIPVAEREFNIVATFSKDCIPDGTPVLFSTDIGTITPTAGSTAGGSVTATITNVAGQATVCIVVGPEAEAFELCVQVEGPALPDYVFLEDSAIDLSTGADVIYALDWCQPYPGTLQPPLLAAGGAVNMTRFCQKPNIFVYSLSDICQTDENGLINPRVFTVTNENFAGDSVNSVKWCYNTAQGCTTVPFLAVGGKTATLIPQTNTCVYYVSSTDHKLRAVACELNNSLASVNAVSWNPECDCSQLTAGGCQQSAGTPVCNIIEYGRVAGQPLLNDVAHTLFDTNVTSLDWCKTNTVPASNCAYLAVGTTGTTPCKGGWDETDQIVVYKASFCKNVNQVAPCQR